MLTASDTVTSLVEELRHAGYARVPGPLDLEAYRTLAAQVGEIVGHERIELRPGAHAYVAKPGRVPLHTDHAEVEVIGWLCEKQDERDGASLLLDASPVIADLDEHEAALLREVELCCPPLEGGRPTQTFPVLRQRGGRTLLFCSPWLKPARDMDGHADALRRIRERISMEERRRPIEIRLQPGEALFVDNQRVLHGRREIANDSKRRLHRVWLRSRAVGALPAIVETTSGPTAGDAGDGGGCFMPK